MTQQLLLNPRWLLLLVAMIVISGSVAFVLLPRQEDPRLTARAARITTVLPGANAKRIEALVTEKLEDELRELEEIKELTSNSSTNLSFVAIELRDEVTKEQVDSIWAKVRDRMEAAHAKMPPETQKPEFKRFDISANALLVGLSWDSPTEVNYSLLRRTLKRLQNTVDGLAGTESTALYGDPEEEILVTLDSEQMVALQLDPTKISQRIQGSDAKMSAGLMRSQVSNTILEVGGELDSVSRVSRIPIQEANAASFLRLGDIAKIEKTIRQPADSLVLIEDQPSIVLGAQIRPTFRIDQWQNQLEPVLEKFESELPNELKLKILFEQNPYVQTRLRELFQNLAIGTVSIFFIVFLMMGWRSALIVGVTLPLVSLAVLTVMHWLGIPMHQMSITGLIVALGLMIDNAIVVVDEVGKKIKSGASVLEAASSSHRFLFFPLLGATITTCLSFSPIILMGGPAGEFVGSIAMVTVIAVIASFALAMLLTTPMAALLIRREDFDGNTPPKRNLISSLYMGSLKFFIARPAMGIACSVLLPTLGFIVAMDLPEQFFPMADRNQFHIEIELSAFSAIEETEGLAKRIRSTLLQDKRIRRVDWFLGESAPVFYYNLIPVRRNAAQYGQAMVTCDSQVDMPTLLREKQQLLKQSFPEATVLVRQLEQGSPFDAPVELRIEGDDLSILRDLGDDLRLLLTETSHVQLTRSGLSEVLPKISFSVDEEQVRLANLNQQAIADQLNSTLEGITGGSVMEGVEELPIRVRVSENQRADLNKIVSIQFSKDVRRENGGFKSNSIPLSALTEMKLEGEHSMITRRNGQRVNEVQAFIDSGVLPAQVMVDFRRRLEDSPFQMPDGYRLSFGGAEAERNDAVDSLIGKGVVIATLIVVALVVSLGSFRFATVLFFVAVLSIGLGLGSLWIAGLPMGFMSIVAIMGMIGVAVNDSIVVLSSLLQLNEHDRRSYPKVAECVVHNSRHIFATTLTTIVGFTPLLISGSEFWTPVAIAMSGGVGGATVLALVFVPCLYVLLQSKPSPFDSQHEPAVS